MSTTNREIFHRIEIFGIPISSRPLEFQETLIVDPRWSHRPSRGTEITQHRRETIRRLGPGTLTRTTFSPEEGMVRQLVKLQEEESLRWPVYLGPLALPFVKRVIKSTADIQ